MPRHVIDVTGQRFGRLLVLRRAPDLAGYPKRAAYECRCDCGRVVIALGKSMRSGNTSSCGCLGAESRRTTSRTHGATYTREYQAWCNAKLRCYSPGAGRYQSYGGRGITMCDDWRDSFEAFYRDMGPCPAGCSIDRIDVNGPYNPSNCRWATRQQQQNNMRQTVRLTFNGRTLTMTEWATELGISVGTLRSRLMDSKWPVERALTTPVRQTKLTKSVS